MGILLEMSDIDLLAVRRRAAAALGDVPPAETAAHRALQAALVQVVHVYADSQQPGLWADLIERAADEPLAEPPAASLDRFEEAFDCTAFTGEPGGRIASLLLVGALLDNVALGEQRALFDAPCVRPRGRARRLLLRLEALLAAAPPVEDFALSLPDMLRGPADASPGSLRGQLQYVLDAWSELLPGELKDRLLRALDVLAEAEASRDGGFAPPPVLEFGPGHHDVPGEARFSRDADWMPNLVLAARQALVWMDQLAREYERPVERLDQIPDEALDELAERGFSGLWLIGLWERSDASKEIKRRMGNPEAEASAYALYDYRIADRFGGDEALASLRHRAAERGIRLAADMVPNHVGLDGRWVVEHPDWFLQTDEPPFPGYSFAGPDLCADDRVSVHLEDGYWNHSDAAVTFKHYEHATGRTRFIYHGNDGTQMPWNDTAQIDYLHPEAREAVISTIVGVAKRFPVIRFDAAMTLAKRHVRRLWHPAPGSGGAIPSRSERAVSPEDFERLMPREFWREVVDRIQAEAPDTLLLAEAFWMMEGYFVRDLGMHRVYNSAFMHMLRDEDNGKYRQTIKNVLEYSPAILERFVNFMNNPDEETAVAQFGKGDKYFGICTLLATLPGLPMFGHGQVEGFTEKYGMEFARAYAGEEPDAGFLEYHDTAIFPLLRMRHVFSGVDQFALYDLADDDGHVNEDVFAYSNRSPDGSERALVVYNNRFEAAAGRLKTTAAANAAGPDEEPRLERVELVDALGLRAEPGVLYGLQDVRTGDWFLRSGEGLQDDGLWLKLDGYGCQVFVGFREIVDHDGTWTELMQELWGGGVADLDAAREALLRRHREAPKAAVQGPEVLPAPVETRPGGC